MTPHRARLLLLFALFCFTAAPLARAADSPPLPERKAVGLEVLEQRITREQAQQKTLKKSLASAQHDVTQTKKSLIKTGKAIRAAEEKLAALEKKIARAQIHEQTLSARLEQEYGSISDLALALNRIRTLPPETLIARPGAPLETAQSAMLLQSALPAIESRAMSVSRDLDALAALQQQLKDDKADQEAERRILAAKERELDSLLQKRQQFYNATNINYARSAVHLERLAKEAENLKDLMAKLAAEEKKRAAAAAAKQKTKTRKSRTQDIPQQGPSNLPVAGLVTVGYGQTDEIGAKSQGLHVQSRPQALVSAPMGGVVRFAGAFKNYGQMVVLEHRGGYHSLIGGLGDINVRLDQKLDAGEPLGRMPSSASHEAPITLYYELRYQGQPVNPAKKLAGLP